MGYDAHANFACTKVATAPVPATSGTTLIVLTGDSTLFPSVPFNAVIWPSGVLPLAANAEVVRVTNVNTATDTLTITRAQESSTAQSVAAGYQIAAAITAKTLTDIEANANGILANQIFS